MLSWRGALALLLARSCQAPHAHDGDSAFRLVLNGDRNLSQPLLSRTNVTTVWRDRDRVRITEAAATNTTPDNASVGMGLSGSLEELYLQSYLTRHGLYRRTDAKFNEMVVLQNRTGDGYGLWRTWESHGPCPKELLITDPWGSVAWETLNRTARPFSCSWIVRPGMYRNGGYMKISRAPVTLIFRTFDLKTEIEFLDVFDGASGNATLLGRFTGRRTPEPITSSSPEIRIVLRVADSMAFTASTTWSNITASLESDALRNAQYHYLVAQMNDVIGFVAQDMRRVLKAMAIRLSIKPQHAWMRKRWFASTSAGFDREFDVELVAVLEGMNMWEKRSRHDEGKESVPWHNLVGSVRYPVAVNAPERNPMYTSVDTSQTAQLQRLDGSSLYEPSGWSLDFVTTADCFGRGVSTYGVESLPPLTLSGGPETNYAFLPFPVEVSSCQPLALSGRQLTADRPFTIADAVMKRAQENEMNACLREGACDGLYDSQDIWYSRTTLERATTQVSAVYTRAGNCSELCTAYMGCVETSLQSADEWVVGHNLYNKSVVIAARRRCVELPEAAECLNLMTTGLSRQNPKSSMCLNMDCYLCGLIVYEKYFNCAIACGQDGDSPPTQCIDCSFGFQDLYDDIDIIKSKVLEGYFMGAVGVLTCPNCNYNDAGSIDENVPMSEPCRECHYVVEDYLNTDYSDCLHFGPTSLRCLSTSRGIYNYNRDMYGEISAEAQAAIDAAAQAALDAALGLT